MFGVYNWGWRNIEAKDLGINNIGAGQPFPTSESKFTWHNTLQRKDGWEQMVARDVRINESCLGYVDEVWKPLSTTNPQNTNYKDFFQGF